MRISFNPNPSIELQNFEEFCAANAAIEAAYGEQHTVTQQMRVTGRKNFNYKSGRFVPEVLKDTDEVPAASVAYEALKKLAADEADYKYAPQARFMIEHAESVSEPLIQPERESIPAFSDPVFREL